MLKPLLHLGCTLWLLLLATLACLWWFLPPSPTLNWQFGSLMHGYIPSEDGRVIAVKTGKGELSVWDMKSGRRLGMYRARGALTLDIVSSTGDAVGFFEYETDAQGNPKRKADPQGLLLPSGERSAKLWKVGSDRAFLELPFGYFRGYSAKEGLIVLQGEDFHYKLGDIRTGKERPLPEPMKNCLDPEVLDDGRIVAVVGEDANLLTLWDLTAEKQLLSLPGVDFDHWKITRDGRRLAAKVDEGVKVWDVGTGREVCLIKRGKEFLTPHQFSPDGVRLVTAKLPGTADELQLWNIEVNPAREETPPAPDLQFRFFDFSPDGKWIHETRQARTGSGPVERLIYSVSDMTRPAPGFLHKEWVPDNLVFAPDSRSVVSVEVEEYSSSAILEWIRGQREKSRLIVKGWDLATGRQLWSLDKGTPAPGQTVDFLTDAQRLIISNGHMIEIWEVPPRRPWYIEYGLPVLFALLVLLGVRMVWRAFRKPPASVTMEHEV